jgi:ABC-type phosphate/phosphonate transport system permease subunit
MVRFRIACVLGRHTGLSKAGYRAGASELSKNAPISLVLSEEWRIAISNTTPVSAVTVIAHPVRSFRLWTFGVMWWGRVSSSGNACFDLLGKAFDPEFPVACLPTMEMLSTIISVVAVYVVSLFACLACCVLPPSLASRSLMLFWPFPFCQSFHGDGDGVGH